MGLGLRPRSRIGRVTLRCVVGLPADPRGREAYDTSERISQAELHAPRIVERSRDATERRVVDVEPRRAGALVAHVKSRMVQNVESLRPQLDAVALGDFNALCGRGIEACIPRT